MSECAVKKIAEDSRGNWLYVEPNEVGGRRYWSDEIGGGVVVWDTSLVSKEMTRLALAAESELGAAHPVEDPGAIGGAAMDNGDNELYLREWANDIRTHNGKSVDADRLDAIADEIASLRKERDEALHVAEIVRQLATPPISDADVDAAVAEARRVAETVPQHP